MGATTFLAKKEARGLEAADLLAYSTYSEQRGQLLGYKPQSVLTNIGKTPVKIYTVDRAGLELVINNRMKL